VSEQTANLQFCLLLERWTWDEGGNGRSGRFGVFFLSWSQACEQEFLVVLVVVLLVARIGVW
jgi:hypothetical protein